MYGDEDEDDGDEVSPVELFRLLLLLVADRVLRELELGPVSKDDASDFFVSSGAGTEMLVEVVVAVEEDAEAEAALEAEAEAENEAEAEAEVEVEVEVDVEVDADVDADVDEVVEVVDACFF